MRSYQALSQQQNKMILPFWTHKSDKYEQLLQDVLIKKKEIVWQNKVFLNISLNEPNKQWLEECNMKIKKMSRFDLFALYVYTSTLFAKIQNYLKTGEVQIDISESNNFQHLTLYAGPMFDEIKNTDMFLRLTIYSHKCHPFHIISHCIVAIVIILIIIVKIKIKRKRH